MHDKLMVRTLAMLCLATLLGGCGVTDKLVPGRDKVDYRQSKTIDNLEIPPELSADAISEAPETLNTVEATYSKSGDAAAAQVKTTPGVLPGSPNLRLERDGDQQWLVVQGEPEQIWPKLREFWARQGFKLKLDDPRIGIIETDWNENRADIPQGAIRRLFSKALDSLYSADTRDKYRVRLEHGAEQGTTEIYLTHRGMEEVRSGNTVDSSTEWQPRAPDPELEAEMTKRLMVFLGVDQEQAQALQTAAAKPPVRAELTSVGDDSLLVIREDFSRAWRRTGVALDRIGFTVDDRDRSSGTYFVKYNDPLGEDKDKGFLSKLAIWSSDEDNKDRVYQIVLQADGAQTNVIVNDKDGKRDKSTTARRILTLLEEQLR